MKRWISSRFRAAWFSTALTFVPAAGLAQENPVVVPLRDEAAVRAVVESFHAALAAGDSAAALASLHPDLVVFEAGHAETLAEYRSGHLASDMAFSQAVAFSTIRDAVVLGSDLSLYLREYSMKGTFHGRAIDGHGSETIVLARTAGEWSIRHIHWSSR